MKKRICISVVFVLLFAAVPLLTAGYASPVVSWGLTPNTQEKTPGVPPYGAKLLAENNGIFVGDITQKKVYFTFDLGYEAGYTAEVLNILKEHGHKAVFFLCGNYVKEKELIGRMIGEGHSVGNHTDRHKDLPALSDEGIQKDIGTLQENFANQYPDAAPMKFFRPPQGRFCARTLKAAQAAGLKTVLWSIAVVDWGREPIDPVKTADKIASRLHPGAVILSHIANSGTPEMLKLLLPEIAGRGYTVGQPGELL